MTSILSIIAWAGQAAPLYHEEGNETLATWKAILTTALLVVVIVQLLDQAVVRGWLPGGRSGTQVLLRLHRALGILAVLLVLVLSGVGLYAALALDAPMESASRVGHAILGVLAAAVLLVKVATSNRFRSKLHLNLPLGIAAAALLAAIFAITALPHFMDLLAPESMAILFFP